ncbi:MAG: hypothetical protein KBE65_10490 [Phycisphaerae bacterium]|nr:hypothetical protein [Phycisphaerae bacterium]
MIRSVLAVMVLCGLMVPRSASAEVREVIITFKTHFDIGYTDFASNVVQRYRATMIDQALKVVDQNRGLPREQQFVWTIPGWPMAKILEDWDGQTAERQQQILLAFKDGRFVVHGLPFTTHTELLEPEDLVRGLGYASRLSREAGLPLPRDAKMTDVPCHSWIMPTLLRHAGIEFLHLGCNAASSSPDVPPLFWWEGPDGSRLLTMYSAAGYGTGLVPPGDWPYRTWLALEHTGDNHGPPTPDEVKKLLAEAAQKLPGVKVRIGRLSDFADAILAEKADIPVIRGDMPDTWIHGPMCDPKGAGIARGIRPDIGSVESLATLLHIWGASVSAADCARLVADAREKSLLYGEHTWGGALSWVTKYGSETKWDYGDAWKADRAAGRFSKLEASWAEHTKYIMQVCHDIVPLIENTLRTLAEQAGPDGRRIVVFNPLPWQRSGIAYVPFAGPDLSALRPADGGPAVPVAAVGDGNDLYFIAPDIPAMGYRTFVPGETAQSRGDLYSDARAGVIENEYLRVALDRARGGIRSVVDKRTGRELADQQSDYSLGQYLYERFDADQVAAYVNAYVKSRSDWAVAELGKPAMPPADKVPHRAASPRYADVDVTHSPISVTATMHSAPTAELSHAVTTRVTLYAGEPYLDLEITLHDKPADNWPEAGWICLPVNAAKPQFRLGRLGGIADPVRDFVRGSNHDLQAIHTGLTVADEQGRGVGICSFDSPLVSLDRPGIFKYSPDSVPGKPVVFFNLFNNQWTTNFRLWNEGTWTTSVRLWAFDRFDAQSSLIMPSLETRYPLLAAAAEGKAGVLPATQKGVELSTRGVLVTAFGPNPDGPGTVFRLWEYAGAGRQCRVHLPSGLDVDAVQPVTLRGEPVGEPIPVKNGEFSVDLAAFAPASFVIPSTSKGSL